MRSDYRFTIGETLLLVLLIGIWLGVTIQLGSFSILFWGLAVAMAAILRPAHQRDTIPVCVTDVLSIAVAWAVACGGAGLALDMRLDDAAAARFSWSVFGQLVGFYLGLVWVLVLFLLRHVERIAGGARRPRPAA